MEYITLKDTDLQVSRLCIGGDPMGGHGWGSVSETALREAINTAVDNGVNFFDTADTYGLGKAESILGETLESRRNHVVIASKFGVRWTSDMKSYYDNSPEWIEQALHASLKRLKREYIDIYQLHWRDYKTPVDEIISTLLKFRDKGLIRHIGLSNIRRPDIADFLPYKQYIITVQNEYSLANRENETDIRAYTTELEVNPMTWGSLGQGILTGKYGWDVKFDEDDRRSRLVYRNFHGAKLLKNLCIVDMMHRIYEEIGRSLPAIAIRFILDFMKNTIAITGVKSKTQVLSNLEAFGWTLSAEQLRILDSVSR